MLRTWLRSPRLLHRGLPTLTHAEISASLPRRTSVLSRALALCETRRPRSPRCIRTTRDTIYLYVTIAAFPCVLYWEWFCAEA